MLEVSTNHQFRFSTGRITIRILQVRSADSTKLHNYANITPTLRYYANITPTLRQHYTITLLRQHYAITLLRNFVDFLF